MHTFAGPLDACRCPVYPSNRKPRDVHRSPVTRHPATHLALGALLSYGCGAEPNEWAPAASAPSASATGVPAHSATTGAVSSSVPAAPNAGETSSVPPSTQPGASTPTVNPKPTPAPELSARTWRLTHDQYRRTIAALFGVDVDLSNFAHESGNGVFVNFSSTSFVRQDLASNYLSTAKKVVAALTREQLETLTSCPLLPECSADFITELGRRVFRRPVPAEMAANYRELVELAVGSSDAVEAGFRAVLIAMLNSPFFLYRSEIGDETSATQAHFELTDHELSNALSFSLIGQAPPPWLAEMADAGQLSDRVVLGSVVKRLLEDPAANDELSRFLTEWLEVHDFEQTTKSDVFLGFETAKPYMWQELEAFLATNGGQNNSLSDLLMGDIPDVSSALTEYYFSDDSAPSDRTTTQRTGVLSLGIVLADHAKSYLTSPTLRGTFVRKRFFCQEITLPPNFTPPPLSQTEALKSARTTRELYEQHQADPTCAPCHDLTDNIGFVFEEFDGAGRVRTLDTTQGGSEPLNLTAPLTGTDVNRTLTSVRDLNAALLESASVRHCLARQAFRFYFGQGESSSELPPISRASEAAAGSTLGALLEGLFTTESTFVRVREPAL